MMFVPKRSMTLAMALTFAVVAVYGIGADPVLAHKKLGDGHLAPGCHTTCVTPCPPPPVTRVLCVVDPCTGCTYEACIKIPAACCLEEPCVTWRWGIFGRKVLTYTWKCCGHCVEIVITKHGRIIVR